jgi:hypothetical protein
VATTRGPRAAAGHRTGGLGAAGHQRHRAVPEQAADHQVGRSAAGHRGGERAHLDGQQHGGVAGPGQQVVVQPGQPGGPGHAAQPEDRQPLDVGPQAEAGDQQRVQRRHHHAGDRGHDQQVHRLGGDPGGGQGAGDGPLAQVGGMLDVQVVRPADVAQPGVLLHRQHDAAEVHARVGEQPLHQGAANRRHVGHLGGLPGQLSLRVPIGRQRAPHRAYPGHAGLSDDCILLSGWAGEPFRSDITSITAHWPTGGSGVPLR